MFTYTGCAPQLVRLYRRSRSGATGLKTRLIPVLLLGLGASCSSLWQPWITTYDPATPPVCDGSAAPCAASDLLPPVDTPDLPSGCGVRLPVGVVNFSVQTTTLSSYFRSVWGSDASHVWAAGDGGALAKWNGTSWTSQNSQTPNMIASLWGTSDTQLVAVGASGTVLGSDGNTWTSFATSVKDSLTDAWGIGGIQNFWAVGNDKLGGFIVKYNGMAIVPVHVMGNLSSIWGIDDNNIWATGGGGNIVVRRNGMSWTPEPGVTGSGLSGVWGLDIKNVWAVGDTGTIVKWDGQTWSKQPSGTSAPLYAVWGIDACNIWAVGGQGAIVRWNGAAWSAEKSGTSADLGGVWASDPRNVWAVGDHGTILHLNAP